MRRIPISFSNPMSRYRLLINPPNIVNQINAQSWTFHNKTTMGRNFSSNDIYNDIIAHYQNIPEIFFPMIEYKKCFFQAFMKTTNSLNATTNISIVTRAVTLIGSLFYKNPNHLFHFMVNNVLQSFENFITEINALTLAFLYLEHLYYGFPRGLNSILSIHLIPTNHSKSPDFRVKLNQSDYLVEIKGSTRHGHIIDGWDTIFRKSINQFQAYTAPPNSITKLFIGLGLIKSTPNRVPINHNSYLLVFDPPGKESNEINEPIIVKEDKITFFNDFDALDKNHKDILNMYYHYGPYLSFISPTSFPAPQFETNMEILIKKITNLQIDPQFEISHSYNLKSTKDSKTIIEFIGLHFHGIFQTYYWGIEKEFFKLLMVNKFQLNNIESFSSTYSKIKDKFQNLFVSADGTLLFIFGRYQKRAKEEWRTLEELDSSETELYIEGSTDLEDKFKQ